MVRKYNWVLFVVMILLVVSLTGCAKKLTDERYGAIKKEFAQEFAQEMLELEEMDEYTDVDGLAEAKLEVVLKRNKYSQKEFLAKMEEMDENWDTLWDEIEVEIKTIILGNLEQMMTDEEANNSENELEMEIEE
jgi:effector-binding domain-containing protein